jgi:hypothetical protein
MHDESDVSVHSVIFGFAKGGGGIRGQCSDDVRCQTGVESPCGDSSVSIVTFPFSNVPLRSDPLYSHDLFPP